ncbi:MAG TPA: YbhB/YbcL family Raf kinase inhibitor-like protein [Candidatus Pacearchaeota archaeon]|nr:YbhB/YbcL family Raf kinase inhibitor-like protein [Candidatus Pacearchaeota archaeon]HOK94220.1 YbhB/YbcL family Raf kinase inhibitor-like protein [Candidatus Pacearchaeota archaeon]HPO75396.1 YbhB/YbcL family Raf kinase inhibitor-like protein [Candidatus Pacearchaeota archaeon]
MQLKSPAFENNQLIPQKYTCDGENINPPLEISEVPSKAKSLVLIVEDPDAPSGNFTHWLIWNINPSIKEIKEGETPEGATEGQNDFSQNSYGGPCPPNGTHHYHFKLYALDTALELDSSTTRENVEKSMKDHILASTELIGLYQR